VVRMGAAIIAMEIVALAVGYLAFDAAALLVGAPIVMATLLVLIVVRAAEIPRRRLAAQRATRWDPEAVQPGGLMSGFFEAPATRRDGVAGR
jgi:small-conductance mechanosensitive channel